MKNRILLPLLGVLMAAAAQSHAQQSFPGSVFSVPDPEAQTYVAEEDQEVESDLGIFLRRGFEAPDWRVHEAFVAEAAAATVVPDYRERTGRDPELSDGRIEIASAMLTNPDFNDMITVSRLPGDCDEMGCLFQVWTLDGEAWKKVFQFRSLSVAYKHGKEDGTHWIAAAGDSVAPSRLYFWDGKEYVQQ